MTVSNNVVTQTGVVMLDPPGGILTTSSTATRTPGRPGRSQRPPSRNYEKCSVQGQGAPQAGLPQPDSETKAIDLRLLALNLRFNPLLTDGDARGGAVETCNTKKKNQPAKTVRISLAFTATCTRIQARKIAEGDGQHFSIWRPRPMQKPQSLQKKTLTLASKGHEQISVSFSMTLPPSRSAAWSPNKTSFSRAIPQPRDHYPATSTSGQVP